MNFGFTEEQEMLREAVRGFLAERCPMEEARRLMEGEAGHSPVLWKEMATLGWVGLLAPEAHGGAGLGFVDLLVVLEEAGRALFPSPLISCSLAIRAIGEGASDDQQARWLPPLAAGDEIATVALVEADDALDPNALQVQARSATEGAITLSGTKLFVTDLLAADRILVACKGATQGHLLAMLRANQDGVERIGLVGMDSSKRMGKLVLNEVRVAAEDLIVVDAAFIERLVDHAAAAVTAEAVGSAEAAHALMVGYAKSREQFGALIGKFQGVKHPLAEMYVDIESFKSINYYAAWCLDEAPDEAARYVSMAKAYASDAMTRIGIDAIELHGAIGYTWEYDAQLFLKRSKWVKSAFGGADHHYDRVARLGGL